MRPDDDLSASVAAIGEIDAAPKILEVICRTTGMRFAAIARVTSDRWVACAVHDEIDFGLVPGGELEVATTICDEIRDSGRAVVIDNVDEDDDFRRHPTPAQYGFKSYISVPIFHRGAFFGTLCAIDPAPALLRNTQTLAMFELFADLIGSHLEARERMMTAEAALHDAHATAELRDQFIAVLGHDLRNPLAAIDGAARLLRKDPPPERRALLLNEMEKTVRRMSSLIGDVMDFARGRLGGGIAVEPRAGGPPLLNLLQEVVDEFRIAHPDRVLEARFALDAPAAWDSGRLAQLMSNLVGNALTHGAPDRPVTVGGETRGGELVLWVANAGDPIDDDTRARMFQPFRRGGRKGEGLGLGLYIAAEIAKAHGGALTVRSDAGETRFTFTMPIRPEATTPAAARVSA